MNFNFTPRQLQVLKMVRDWRLRRGYSPTLQELADEFGISKVTVFEHVEALIQKGALSHEPHRTRSLNVRDGVVVPDERQPTTFPLVGRIAAGYPIEKMEDRNELSLEEVFGPKRGQSGATFALQVEGDSMKDEGIWHGDYVIVERRSTARNGDRVVALLPNGETTLKTFRREGSNIRLEPANPDFEPIIVKERECQVQGVVIGVLRRYQ